MFSKRWPPREFCIPLLCACHLARTTSFLGLLYSIPEQFLSRRSSSLTSPTFKVFTAALTLHFKASWRLAQEPDSSTQYLVSRAFLGNLAARLRYSITTVLWMHSKTAPCAWFQILLSAWEIPRCSLAKAAAAFECLDRWDQEVLSLVLHQQSALKISLLSRLLFNWVYISRHSDLLWELSGPQE